MHSLTAIGQARPHGDWSYGRTRRHEALVMVMMMDVDIVLQVALVHVMGHRMVRVKGRWTEMMSGTAETAAETALASTGWI